MLTHLHTPAVPYLAIIPLLLTLGRLAPARGETYYVSPEGSDANSGLHPQQALRTLQAGVNKLQPGDTLLVKAGVYRESVTFPRSGQEGKPIVVRAAEGERVIITGCDPIVGWTRHTDTIWKAPMPWTLGLGRNQVFADGQVMIEARFPNEPDPGLGMYVSDLSPLWPTFGEFSIPEPLKDPGRVVSRLLDGQPEDYWKGAIYYGVHYEGWCAQTGVIERSGPGWISVGDRTQTWWFGPAYGGGYQPEEGRGMIVGHMHALDRPGEWHWQDGVLYLIPRGAGEPVNVEAKRRQLAFDLSGREHIHLQGLDIHAASLRLDESAHCVVERCNLSYISHYTRHYSIGQVEHDRDTLKSGETGIFVSGHDNAFLSCTVRYSAGAGFYLRGYHHTIHNCLIDEVSYTSHYLNAITDAVSDFGDYEDFLVGGHVITFNTMRNAGRHFFNFHGNGTSLSSRDRGPMDYMATLFAHNHLYNGMLQTKDAGMLTGYYCSGGTLNGLNSQVVYNVLHDSYDIFAMRIGALGLIYLDAGTCDVDLHHNLLWAAPGSLQRGLWYNTMCVDIHEHDNVFHPEFTRTCAELQPEDFPEGKPFRFGHDHDNPPPVPEWPQLIRHRLHANACCSIGPRLERHADVLAGLQDGDWFAFDGVDFDEGWQSAVLRFASDVRALNTDRSTRAQPRHRHATDPLVLEATVNDGAHEGVRTQWTFIYEVHDGAWLRFSQVPLGEGYRRFRVVYGNDQPAPRQLEVRLDSVDGPLAGRVDLPQTDVPRGGRIQIYAEATGAISPEASGTRDVFLVFRAPDGKPVGEFEYFRFEQYRGSIALHETEVRLELRLGSPDGEKIGELYPRYTGGPTTFRDLITPLEPAHGKRPLYVMVRSALPGPVGSVAWLSLEKAKQPPDLPGIGIPPLMREGRMVLPPPTHRPCARPADKYPRVPRASGPLGRPRAVASAMRLQMTPVLDGRLDDWPIGDADRTLLLSESFDGTPTAAPHSQAWVGYDSEALYIALHNPVANAAGLLPSSHTWGQVDGVEVAFQDGLSRLAGPILALYGYPDGHFESRDYSGGTPRETVQRLAEAASFQAVVGADEWTCEWRIPFAACGFTPTTAPVILLNLGVRKTSPLAWVIWRGTGGATYDVARGGVLAFPAELLEAGPPQEGLEVWLDASDATTLTLDEAGKVAVWRDRSGKGRHASQAAPAFRPRLVLDAVNGKPALRFDENSRTHLQLPDLSDHKITATIFAVISTPQPGAEVNHDPRISTASDGTGYDYQVGLCCCIPGMETGGPRLIISGATDAWAKHVRVGCFSPLDQTYLKGDIAEIVVYSRALPEDEQDRVRAYLTTKWDLR